MAVNPAHRIPQISLLMVVRNGAAHIDAAIASARRQTIDDLEIIVVDDGSTDATCSIVHRHATEDARVRLESGSRQGLAAVRNHSLALTRAPWAAILDSDDILHPLHAQRLLELAARQQTPIAAMNMIAFGDETADLFAQGSEWSRERTIDLAAFVEAGQVHKAGVSLGYLKPMFRIEALAAHDLRYDPRLRIGEDYDLVERALAKGLTYAFSPDSTYFYRRHEGSTSFRLTCEDLRALILAENERPEAPPGSALSVMRTRRRHSLEAALAHAETVSDLKAGRVASSLARLWRDPASISMLAASAREGLGRRFRKRAAPAQSGWSALLCGIPLPGSRMEQAARLLAGQGCEMRWIENANLVDPVVLARAGRGVSLVLLADETQCDAAAFAIADGAPVFGDGSFAHPIIDRQLPSRLPDMVHLAPQPDEPASRVRSDEELAA
jgi:succinoglycan biosynthesis protein ExoO